ncbi:hypothetical protein DN062_01335 [Nitrincola tibetensis]|uniref:Uncharacterized protein n=1 Tax=Nitrincola tibetensis TaxID=2219697 RepID=A0A364NS94_9GAMM|nr:hypothetical protein DN062_01335 [Nitrincola tibetensis]
MITFFILKNVDRLLDSSLKERDCASILFKTDHHLSAQNHLHEAFIFLIMILDIIKINRLELGFMTAINARHMKEVELLCIEHRSWLSFFIQRRLGCLQD